MKEVAGTLRLDLAAYRELAAFSQFASDLDDATQRQLAKGARLTELLKQGQYIPMNVEHQIIQLLAGNEGVLNDLPLKQVGGFAKAMNDHFESNKRNLLDEILERGTLKKEGLKDRLLAEIRDFKSTWNPA
jgi:F-type H+-transporting ATPase subunit alpha